MSRTVSVLSIDGGGIRGIVPALILAEIERRAGKPISHLFDLIAGTSTGGILALGLTKPDGHGQPRYSAQDGVALYERDGARIFSRTVWHEIHAIGNIAEEKYPADSIERVLDEHFGETRLSEATTDVIVTGYEIERRFPFFFKSRKAKREPGWDYPMKAVARATSAAPTYFEPTKVPALEATDYYALIDGGVFANNPAMCAYAEARSVFADADDYLVVSLGTGELTRRLPFDRVRGWGLARWAQPVLQIAFDGVSHTVDYQLRQMLPRAADGSKRYFRFQARLDSANDDMDDASLTNVRALRLLAEAIMRDCDDDLTALSQRLRTLSDEPR